MRVHRLALTAFGPFAARVDVDLDDAGRVQELSRMLAGLEESDTAMAHAQELLEVARGVASRRSRKS